MTNLSMAGQQARTTVSSRVRPAVLCLAALILPWSSTAPPVQAETRLALAPVIQHWHYREVSERNKELNNEQGWLAGMQADLQYGLPADNELAAHQLNAEILSLGGTLVYDGQTQVGTPFISDTDTRYNHYLLSWQFTTRHGFRGELGYARQAWDRLIQSRGNIRGLDEYYRWQGPMVGFRYVETVNQWRLVAKARGYLWNSGEMTVDLADIGYGKPKLQLDSGYSLDLELKSIYSWLDQTDWVIQLGYGLRHFDKTADKRISNGTVVVSIHEPESDWQGWTLATGLRWSW